LAEGEGRNAVYLAQRGFAVTAVDGSPVGLEKLHKLAQSRGVKIETVVSDLRDIENGSQKWDVIVSIWCHLPSELRKTVHAKCVKGLRAGGLMILEAYRPKQLEYKTGGPPSADLMMTLDALKQDFSELVPLHAIETDRQIHEGKGHKGMSAVVQYVGRKP
jgi:cyclopropane fatty-acyl-phospholipid synthase-like methyltransferase